MDSPLAQEGDGWLVLFEPLNKTQAGVSQVKGCGHRPADAQEESQLLFQQGIGKVWSEVGALVLAL